MVALQVRVQCCHHSLWQGVAPRPCSRSVLRRLSLQLCHLPRLCNAATGLPSLSCRLPRQVPLRLREQQQQLPLGRLGYRGARPVSVTQAPHLEAVYRPLLLVVQTQRLRVLPPARVGLPLMAGVTLPYPNWCLVQPRSPQPYGLLRKRKHP